MTEEFNQQNIIAIIWDFDKTLSPDYMQKPLFKKYKVNSDEFWREVEALPKVFEENGLDLISRDTLYLNHILNYVRNGDFENLSNKKLFELGKEIQFYRGIPSFFSTIKEFIQTTEKYRLYDIKLEHYIVSTGLRQMILGSEIAEYVDGVWACEFVEYVPKPGFLSSDDSPQPISTSIQDIGYVIDNTTKTRAIFEINKGSNKIPEIDVNANVPQAYRRIPFENMIYIADGPSDIPVFSVLNQYNGTTFAVYKQGSKQEFQQVSNLLRQRRIQAYGPADYSRDSHMHLMIQDAVERIADKIVETKERLLNERVGNPPHHLNEAEIQSSTQQYRLGEFSPE